MGEADQLSQIHHTLGMLTASVEALRRDLHQFEETSRQSRANTHRRLDEMVDRAGKLEVAVATQSTQIAEIRPTTDELVARAGRLEVTVNAHADQITVIKPVTDEVRMWKQRGIGALALAGIAGTVLGLSAASVGTAALNALAALGKALTGR